MELLLLFGLIAGIIFITRLFGAWMLRINDVIRELKEIKKLLKSLLEIADNQD